jgi:hypothetical protein
VKNSSSTTLLCISLLVFLLLFNSSVAHAQWEKIVIDSLGAVELIFPAVGDIEDDGDMDVLVAQLISEEPFVGNILLYKSPDWTKYVIDDDVGAVKAADLNSDDTTDIVAANINAGQVVWYEAPSWTRHIIGTLPFALGVEVVDLDNDTDLDVVATAVDPNQIVWYEAPDWIVHTIADESESPADPFFIVSADIDDDDDIDVIVASEDGVILFEAPAWTQHPVTDTDTDGWGQIDVGCIDTGNDLDIAVVGPGDTVSWYENPAWTQHLIDADQPGAWGLALADLNKDEAVDVIASGGESNEVAWYEAPTWTKHVIDNSLAGAAGLSAAYMNGDNFSDVVACGKDAGHVVFYRNPGHNDVSSDNLAIEIPKSFTLHQNYPNPFNPSTEITYELEKSGHVSLEVFDISGNKVRTLVNGYRSVGVHETTFHASNLASGVYFCRMKIGNTTEIRKMVLLR